MLKHPSKSTQVFTHALAAYPLEWKEYVISEQKICLQFENVQLKTRVREDTSMLRSTPWGALTMPVDTHGTEISTLAVGIPLRLYPELLDNILTAIHIHSNIHKEHSLKDFMLQYADKIKEIFNNGQ